MAMQKADQRVEENPNQSLRRRDVSHVAKMDTGREIAQIVKAQRWRILQM